MCFARVHYVILRPQPVVFGCCVSWCYGGYSGGETPGYIPNPEVKPSSADGTAPGTVWESRSLPDFLLGGGFHGFCLWGLPLFFYARTRSPNVTVRPSSLELVRHMSGPIPGVHRGGHIRLQVLVDGIGMVTRVRR